MQPVVKELTKPQADQDQIDLRAVLSARILPGTKGLPPEAVGARLDQIGGQNWNLLDGDLPLPACVLKQDALDHNRAMMREFVERNGVRLALHGKTTMAPQLFANQLADGAWGMSAATPAHLYAYRSLGIGRILYANQLVDPLTLDFVLTQRALDPDFDFICLVDSIPSVEILIEAIRRHPGGGSFDVLIELGLPGGRTGLRTVAEAVELGHRLKALAPLLRLRGVEAFEGVVNVGTSEAITQVNDLFDRITAVMDALNASDAFARCPPIVSAGGSAYFGLAAEFAHRFDFPTQVILRSGCYLTNDNGLYSDAQRGEAARGHLALRAPLQPAIEVWAHVQSRPEPGLSYLTLGKRDISHDIHMPVPLKWSPRASRDVHTLDAGFVIEG